MTTTTATPIALNTCLLQSLYANLSFHSNASSQLSGMVATEVYKRLDAVFRLDNDSHSFVPFALGLLDPSKAHSTVVAILKDASQETQQHVMQNPSIVDAAASEVGAIFLATTSAYMTTAGMATMASSGDVDGVNNKVLAVSQAVTAKTSQCAGVIVTLHSFLATCLTQLGINPHILVDLCGKLMDAFLSVPWAKLPSVAEVVMPHLPKCKEHLVRHNWDLLDENNQLNFLHLVPENLREVVQCLFANRQEQLVPMLQMLTCSMRTKGSVSADDLKTCVLQFVM